MIVNIRETPSTTLNHARERKVAKPSTFKERVFTDRIVMAAMLIATIIFAIVTS